jgi:hypothetical protein
MSLASSLLAWVVRIRVDGDLAAAHHIVAPRVVVCQQERCLDRAVCLRYISNKSLFEPFLVGR